MVGLVLEIDNVAGGWYGEGDDMVFIDGDTWPPRIHGTGHEEVFGSGACTLREFAGPYAGFHLVEHDDYRVWWACTAGTSPTPSASTGRCAGRSSTATPTTSPTTTHRWRTGTRPSRTPPFPALPDRDAMRPPLPDDFDQVRAAVIEAMVKLAGPAENLPRIATFAEPYYRGEFELALERVRALDL